ARRDCRRGSNWATAGKLRLWAGRTARPGFLREFGNLGKRLPGCHPLPPAEIGAGEFSAAQSFAHFIFRECSQAGAAAVDMKSSHSVGFYVVAALVSSTEVLPRCGLEALKGYNVTKEGRFNPSTLHRRNVVTFLIFQLLLRVIQRPPTVPGQHGTIRLKFAPMLVHLFRRRQFSFAENFRETFAHSVVVHWPDIRTPKVEKQKHFHGPAPNPAHLNQMLQDFIIR